MRVSHFTRNRAAAGSQTWTRRFACLCGVWSSWRYTGRPGREVARAEVLLGDFDGGRRRHALAAVRPDGDFPHSACGGGDIPNAMMAPSALYDGERAVGKALPVGIVRR